ncbi:MAG: hypothetical protein QXV22_04335 [Thermoplasmataceae archaeon]
MDYKIEEASLKDQVISILGTEGKSIVGLQRVLSELGIRENRIFLSGYLKALVNVGILQEKEMKPSKVYSVNTSKSRDIYDIVGEVARSSLSGDPGGIALMLLNFIFNRPIFFREIERCNVDPPSSYRKVMHPRRIDLVKKLSNLGIVVPQNNILVEPETLDHVRLMRMVRTLLINGLNLKQYLLDENEFRQSTLD